jgi:hypothetical protein
VVSLGDARAIIPVELHHGEHLYWPALDVDLDLERIAHPESFRSWLSQVKVDGITVV